MVLYCVVPECKNNSRTPGISLHRFPTDERKKKAWCLKMRRHGKISTAMRVCSAHFLPEDYRYISSFRKCLKEGAEPTVFPYDTSQETEAPLGFLLSMPKSKKDIQAWELQDKIIAPPLEDFLELPLKYTRDRKMENRFFHFKDKTATALFPTKVKKNIQESPNNIPYIKKEINKILGVDFDEPHSVYDPKAWKWLKRSKKTKKTFINYFASGMSPCVAIQHHESMLCFENPDLLNDNKRNPPRAWVYSLYDSWLNETEGNASAEFKTIKPRISDNELDNFSLKSYALVKVSSMNKDDSVVQQKHPQAPCIIHMNNKLTDDYEDLKYLLIPDEVKELFYKYFDDGLNVSEAMELNEENLKRNRNWPQFNPSERVVNFMYKIWHQQTKSHDDSSRDSGFVSFNEKNYIGYDSSFESLSEHADCQNFTVTSQLTPNSNLKEPTTVVSQCEMNYSPETAMKVLSFPFTPPSSSSNPLLVENDNVASEIVKSPSQTKEKMYEKMPVLPKVDYIIDPGQNQFITISSQNKFSDTVIAPVNSVPVNSFSIKTDFSNNQISTSSVMNETKICTSPRKSPLYEEKSLESSFDSNKLYCFSDFPNNQPFHTVPESSRFSCQTTFSDSFNELKVSNYSEPSIMKDPSDFHPATIYDTNINFEINSENNENGHHSFHTFEEKASESDSKLNSGFMELSHVYSTSQLYSRTNTFSLSSPSFINEYNIVKEMPNKSTMDDFSEPVVSDFAPAVMNISSISPTNDEMSISFTDEENEECVGISGIEHFKIATLELSKQNEDQKFLMSLLPEFECIPDCFKAILKNDILNLVRSTKLRANDRTNEES